MYAEWMTTNNEQWIEQHQIHESNEQNNNNNMGYNNKK